MTDGIDLGRYLERIDYRGPRAVTPATLSALTRAHACSIPFENIDALLRRRIELAPATLYRKLVLARRGGYCFEQNGLFLEVLRRLGFEVRPLGARVRLGVADRAVLPQRTHMLIEARFGRGRWITDVGVGAASLTAALRLRADIGQPTPHEPRRLQRAGERWFHQIWHGGAWSDVYEFTLDDFPPVDREVANWYTSTCPESHFHSELTLALARPHGRRTTLHGHTLSHWAADGSVERRRITGQAALRAALEGEFGIVLAGAADPMAALERAIDGQPGDASV